MSILRIRNRSSFDWNWKFEIGDQAGASKPDWDDSRWRTVHLPHDWSIEGEYDENHPSGRRGGYLPGGIAWYRASFEWDSSPAGRSVFLEFEGVYMNSTIWINGHQAYHRPNGYMGFEIEFTGYLRQGTNTIAVRVDNSKCPSARWYTGCGIYRHVWLTETSDVHVAQYGTYVTTPVVNDEAATVRCETKLRNSSGQSREVVLNTSIISPAGDCVAMSSAAYSLAAKETTAVACLMDINMPERWSPDHPALYTLVTEIYENGVCIDDYATEFGIRALSFDSRNGFMLNGVSTKLRGVCHHHDAGPVGAAVPDKLIEKRLRLLKEMGCNAIRTGHHPMAPEFYRLCSRIGIMVMDESFDGWGATKAEYDYGLYFNEWWQQDLGDMIARDRNHPCVILWSLGNEVHKMEAATARELVEFVHRLDPTRPVSCGVQQVGPDKDEVRSILDVAGYNDGGGACFAYEQDHQKHPERVMVATEAPHTFQTRGFYRTMTWWRDKNRPRIEIPNLTEEELFFDGALQYNSSYDNSGVRTSARHSLGFVEKYPFLIGEFRWTGFDYLGESFGWPARSANFGIIDLANFPKDHYYFYQSRFTRSPMVHLLPHWTHPGLEGTAIPVWVYTNCEEAELLLNGRSLGRKRMGEEMYLSWDVPYEPGTLKAVGYRDGSTAAEKQHETSGEPAGIRLAADNTELQPDGRDLTQVSYSIVDADGRLVPSGDNAVAFHITGPAVLLGTENGDPLDLTPAQSPVRKAFYGLGMGLIQSTREEGPIEVMAAVIAGQSVFEQSATVCISLERIELRSGGSPTKSFSIYYTTDGSEPHVGAMMYTAPFRIEQTCRVRAAVALEGKVVLLLQADFRRGVREKVIDSTHGNLQTDMTDKFPGPFAEQICGVWTDGVKRYEFRPDGTAVHSIGKETPMPFGAWWYDYPADPFETPDYSGSGELRLEEGNKLAALSLSSQKAERLHIQLSNRVLVLERDSSQAASCI